MGRLHPTMEVEHKKLCSRCEQFHDSVQYHQGELIKRQEIEINTRHCLNNNLATVRRVVVIFTYVIILVRVLLYITQWFDILTLVQLFFWHVCT